MRKGTGDSRTNNNQPSGGVNSVSENGSFPLVVDHHGPVYVHGVSTSHSHVEGLRPRQCYEPSCGAMFAVCSNCDRAVSAVVANCSEAAGGATKSGLRASVTRQARWESTRIVDDGRPTASVAVQRQ